MPGDQAQKLCPDIALVRVLERRGKADLTKYRKACTEVMQSLSHFSDCLERASVDEAFIDVTSVVEQRMKDMPFLSLKPEMLENTRVVGWESLDDQVCGDVGWESLDDQVCGDEEGEEVEAEGRNGMGDIDINEAGSAEVSSSSEQLAADAMPRLGSMPVCLFVCPYFLFVDDVCPSLPQSA